jgi:type II secretory pathway pseudopilin PulG
MQLYAGFALVVIAIVAIIMAAALVTSLIRAVRRLFGRTRAQDDFSAPAPASRHAPLASRKDKPPASH